VRRAIEEAHRAIEQLHDEQLPEKRGNAFVITPRPAARTRVGIEA
jgi:hypothetical protein